MPDYKVADISAGVYNGLADKLKFAAEKYRETVISHPEVREYAEKIVGKGTRAQQAGNMFAALRKAYIYTGDPLGFTYKDEDVGVEFIKAPWEMVEQINDKGQANGDCDDQAVLNYTLLQLVGIPARLRVAWYDQNVNPGHIYAMAQLSGDWVAFDTTARQIGFEKPTVQTYDWPK